MQSQIGKLEQGL